MVLPEGFRPGARRAMGRPSRRSRPVGVADRTARTFRGAQTSVAGLAALSQKGCEIFRPIQHRLNLGQFVVTPGEMRPHARPRPVPGTGDQSRPNRIEAHIAHAGQKVILVHRHRTEPPLEQMARPPPSGVDEVGVASMRLAHRPAQPVSGLRGQDQVHVIGPRPRPRPRPCASVRPAGRGISPGPHPRRRSPRAGFLAGSRGAGGLGPQCGRGAS